MIIKKRTLSHRKKCQKKTKSGRERCSVVTGDENKIVHSKFVGCNDNKKKLVEQKKYLFGYGRRNRNLA